MATAREDLLKSIDSRINVEFADYEQWTRKTKPSKTQVKSDGKYSLFVNNIHVLQCLLYLERDLKQ